MALITQTSTLKTRNSKIDGTYKKPAPSKLQNQKLMALIKRIRTQETANKKAEKEFPFQLSA